MMANRSMMQISQEQSAAQIASWRSASFSSELPVSTWWPTQMPAMPTAKSRETSYMAADPLQPHLVSKHSPSKRSESFLSAREDPLTEANHVKRFGNLDD